MEENTIVYSNLKDANEARQLEWDIGKEKVSNLFRAIELAGEVGELLNAIKKIERSNYGIAGALVDQENLEDEFGDVMISLLLLANSMGVNLDKAAARKFNKTSIKYGFKTRVKEYD